jgi:hypothetical protein
MNSSLTHLKCERSADLEERLIIILSSSAQWTAGLFPLIDLHMTYGNGVTFSSAARKVELTGGYVSPGRTDPEIPNSNFPIEDAT